MIDVPARVKDALRSGDYKKEYKINVYGAGWVYIKSCELNAYGTASDVTVSTNGTYKIYVELPNAFTQIAISVNGGVPSLEPAVSENNETYIEYEMVVGATYTLIVQNKQGSYSELNLAIYKEETLLYTIDNSNLVSETVKFDERMCSDSELKFGLCEGTSIEFQYFDFPSILGKHLNIELDVEYKKADGTLDWHTIPMGQFDVAEISRQASTGIIKVTAYNKLMSKYLDQDVTADLISMISSSGTGSVMVNDVLSQLLEGYGIQQIDEIPIDSKAFYKAIDESHGTYYGVALCEAISVGMTDVYRVLGHRFAIYYEKFTISTETKWNSEKYYRFILKLATLKTYIESLYSAGISNFTHKSVWVGPNIDVDHGDRSYLMNLVDYMQGEETYSAYLSGFIEVRYTNDSPDYYRIYPSGGTINMGYITNVMSALLNVTGFMGVGVNVYLPILVETIEIPNDGAWMPATMDLTSSIDPTSSKMVNATQSAMNVITGGTATANSTLEVTYAVNVTDINTVTLDMNDLGNMSSAITLRDLQSAVYEANCQYGKLDRVSDLFNGIELNNGALYPRDNLYPADNLYPQGNAEAGYPSMYSKLWADEGNVRSFRNLIITYKTTETIEGQTQEVEKTLQRTVNADGTDDYNMSDNWLFKNLVWTAADVGDYADAMVTKMQNIRWFPFEMWCAGLPYLEAGDEIEITMNEGTYKSYVLRRTLNGIQNLQDEMINGTLDIF